MAHPSRRVYSRILSASIAITLLLAIPLAPSHADPPTNPPPSDESAVLPLSWSAASVRVAGADRLQTSVAVSQQGWEHSDYVVIATARAFPDALAGGPLAYLYGAPLLTTEPDRLPAIVADEIRRLGATTAIVLGGPAAVSLAVDAQLYDAGITTVERIGGADRYETAGLVAERFAQRNGGAEGVIVATGQNFPDALAVSGFAGWYGTPILLTRKDAIPAGTLRALGTIDPGSALIVGGAAAVSPAVESALPNPVRIGGADRYDTARMIAEFAFSNGFSYKNVFVATGENFPDALASGPLAAGMAAPVVLTSRTMLSAPTDEFFNAHCSSIETVFVLGGEAAVSPEVVAKIEVATETRISENVQVLSATTVDSIETIEPDGTMVIDASAPGVSEIAEADVLVSGPTALAPYGFLVRVVSVNVSPAQGDTVSLETEPASLDEVIEKGSIDVTGSVDPSFAEPPASTFDVTEARAVGDTAVQVDFAPHDDSVSPAWSLGGQLNIPFGVNVDAQGKLKTAEWGASAKAEGNVFMRGDFVFNLAFGTVGYKSVQEWYFDWGWKTRWVKQPITGITSMEMKVYLSQSFEINLSVAASISQEIDVVELLKQKGIDVEVELAQTWFWVGWVPVHMALSAEPIIDVGLDFAAKGSVGFKQTSSVTVGCSYDYRTGWRDLGASSLGFEFTPPTLVGTAEASLAIGAKVNVTFYGMFGPYLGTTGTLELDADTSQNPWWDANLALDGLYGGRFEIFSRSWSVHGTIPFADWTIAEASGPFPSGGVVWWPSSVQPMTASVGEFTPVSWDVGPTAASASGAAAGRVAAASTPLLAIDPTTVDPSDFAIEGLTITDAVVLPSGDQIMLTVSPMERGRQYVVTCAAGALFDMLRNPVMLSIADFVGYYRPVLRSAWADSGTAAVVEFDVGAGALDPSSVEASDFTIPGLVVTGATLAPGGSQVYLTTSAQSAGVSYTVQCADGAVISIEGFPCSLSSSTFFGFYSPTVASVRSAGSTSVEVAFDAEGSSLDAALLDPASFSIAGLTVSGASLQPDGVTVVLTTSAQSEGAAYTLNVADSAVTSVEGYTCAGGSADFTGYYEPAVVSARADGVGSVEVAFDAAGSALDDASVAPSDFAIAGLGVLGAVLQPDGVTVLLTTDAQTPGVSYTVDVNAGSVTSVEGYPGAAASAGFVGYWPVTADYAYDVDSTTVDIVFDSMNALDPASLDPADFAVRTRLTLAPLAVVGAVLQPDGRTVRLTVAPAAAGVAYEVLIAEGVLSDGTFVNLAGSVTFTGTSTFSESAGNIGATDTLFSIRSLDSVTAFATGMQGFTYRTTNGGTTWTRVANAQPGAVGNSYYIAFPNPASPLTIVAPGYGGSFSRSTNGATSWTRFYSSAVTTNHNSGCDFAGATGRGYAVHGAGGLLESTDGGVSWHRHPTQDAEVRGSSVVFADDLRGYIGWSAGRVWVTSDSGASWTMRSTESTGTFIDMDVSPDDPLVAVAASSDGKTVRTEDGGQTWAVSDPGTGLSLNEIDFADGNVVFAAGKQGLVLMSRDAGRTWTTIRWNATANDIGALWARDANSLWFAGLLGANYRMTGN